MSGIDQDVFLMGVPQIHVSDSEIQSTLDTDHVNGLLRVQAELDNALNRPVSANIEFAPRDPRGQTAKSWTRTLAVPPETTASAVVEERLPSVSRWTAETPHLYTLEIRSATAEGPAQTVRQRIGSRTVEVRDRQLLVNGRPVELRGSESPGT